MPGCTLGELSALEAIFAALAAPPERRLSAARLLRPLMALVTAGYMAAQRAPGARVRRGARQRVWLGQAWGGCGRQLLRAACPRAHPAGTWLAGRLLSRVASCRSCDTCRRPIPTPANQTPNPYPPFLHSPPPLQPTSGATNSDAPPTDSRDQSAAAAAAAASAEAGVARRASRLAFQLMRWAAQRVPA